MYFFGAPQEHLPWQSAICSSKKRCVVFFFAAWFGESSESTDLAESRVLHCCCLLPIFYILPSVYHFWLEEKWNSSCVSSLFRTESVDLRESFQEEPVNFLCFKIVNFLHKIFSNPSVGDSFQSSCVKE